MYHTFVRCSKENHPAALYYHSQLSNHVIIVRSGLLDIFLIIVAGGHYLVMLIGRRRLLLDRVPYDILKKIFKLVYYFFENNKNGWTNIYKPSLENNDWRTLGNLRLRARSSCGKSTNLVSCIMLVAELSERTMLTMMGLTGVVQKPGNSAITISSQRQLTSGRWVSAAFPSLAYIGLRRHARRLSRWRHGAMSDRGLWTWLM